METALKTTLAKKNLEMEKLEQSKKSHLRMINSCAARLKHKLRKTDDPKEIVGETKARKIRMYETHFPGFCYLRNGEYRKKSTSSHVFSNPDPVQCSEKVKEILFTDNELDIYKTICLHLLGTHVQSKNHIQRKDGRLCSYVKAQMAGNVPNTLQLMTQRINIHGNELSSKYDKMLPRYILDAKILHPVVSSCSFKTADLDSGSDDEIKKKRKCLVPVYINNEIKIIINSVLEALESTESSKLKDLTELASSPEELRNLLSRDEIQEIILDFATNPLVMKPTSYDFVMTRLMFDKIPEEGTLETIAQVLEVHVDLELHKSLNQIRRGILLKHLELTNTGSMSRKKKSRQENPSGDNCRSFLSINLSLKQKISTNSKLQKQHKIDSLEEDRMSKKQPLKHSINENSTPEAENCKDTIMNTNNLSKSHSRSVSLNLENVSTDGNTKELEDDEKIPDDDMYRPRNSFDSNRCYMPSLNNSQRILLGLKIASLKSRPINMHQFEGKKKVDIAAIINPIIGPQVSDINYKQHSPENNLENFALPEKKIKKSLTRISTVSTDNVENLSRELLTNLRLEISETENKKRINQFIAKI